MQYRDPEYPAVLARLSPTGVTNPTLRVTFFLVSQLGDDAEAGFEFAAAQLCQAEGTAVEVL